MSYPLDRGLGYSNSVNVRTIGDVAEEVVRARTKFPANKHMIVALMEEVGELANALLEDRPIGKHGVYREAMQVAAVAMRIMEEGDADFDYEVSNWNTYELP